MTRNREIDCEDILGCDHEPETPVLAADGQAIAYWICRCGRRRVTPDEIARENEQRGLR